MALKTIGSCANCGYPLAAEAKGEQINCPMCSTINEAISGVDIPNPIFWGGLGILAGLILAKSKFVSRQLAKI